MPPKGYASSNLAVGSSMQYTCKLCGRSVKRKRDVVGCSVCRKQSRQLKSIESPKPYKGHRVYGPRIENTGRWAVSLVNQTTKKQFTMSLARYVMSIGLGRVIDKSKHVDHIDMNPLNDTWSNLQLLEVSTNLRKGSASGYHERKTITFTCPICTKRTTQWLAKSANTRPCVMCCSRDCAYIFQSQSRNQRDVKVVRKAKAINNIVEGSVIRDLLGFVPVGERIPFKTKGMRRVHNFTKLKGVSIL